MTQKNPEIEKKILNLKSTTNNATDFFAKLKSEANRDLYDEIVKFTPLLDGKNLAFRTRVYWYLNNIAEFPICEVCKTPLDRFDVKNLRDGYPKTCSRECTYASKSRSKNIHDSLMNRTPEQKALTQEKTIATCRKRYGTDYSFQSDNNKQKTIATSLRKYGVKTPGTSPESKKKAMMTVRKKYGVDNVFQADFCKEKTKATLIDRYGVDHPMKSQSIRDRAIETCKMTKRNQSWDIMSNDQLAKPLFTKDFFLEHFSNDFEYEFECTRCGNHFKSNYANGVIVKHCPLCFPKTSSVAEKMILHHLQSVLPIGTDIIQNSKNIIKPLEIDIFIPDFKLAIEFDGLYWHSFQNLSKSKGSTNYHLKKTEMCENSGIRLVHIYEDEWEHHKDIVIGQIDRILGINMKEIKCDSIEEQYNNDIVDEFLEHNCIFGSCDFDFAYVMKRNDELMYVATFNSTDHGIELSRSCHKIGVKVTNAEKIVIQETIKNHQLPNICVSIDRRWQCSNEFELIGFKKDDVDQPDFEYITPDHLHRIKKEDVKTKVQIESLRGYEQECNLHEVLLDNGYEMIYDCGKVKMSFEAKNFRTERERSK